MTNERLQFGVEQQSNERKILKQMLVIYSRAITTTVTVKG
jgi:hypothetical protein|tara:strand:- start:149 stop:268 length:120 start_codon:yes stop_codon:yes gene_type:complete